MVPVFGSHGDYGGHRAPRDRTISFRLQDARGRFRSNVVWLMPDWMSSLTAGNIRAMVAEANGKRKRRSTPKFRWSGASREDKCGAVEAAPSHWSGALRTMDCFSSALIHQSTNPTLGCASAPLRLKGLWFQEREIENLVRRNQFSQDRAVGLCRCVLLFLAHQDDLGAAFSGAQRQ